MTQYTPWWTAFAILAAALWLAGCNGSTPPSGTSGDHDHGHEESGHTHTHAGPHKGHVMMLGKGEHHAEWTHDDQGKVTFYILDAAAEKEVPIEASEISVDVKIGMNDPQTFKLAAVNPQEGKTAAFELADTNLEGALEQIKSPGVVCTLHVNINGQQYDEEIKEKEYTDDHGHAH